MDDLRATASHIHEAFKRAADLLEQVRADVTMPDTFKKVTQTYAEEARKRGAWLEKRIHRQIDNNERGEEI